MATPRSRDAVTEGIETLIEFWKDKPNAQGYLRSVLSKVKELEEVAFQLLNERSVRKAVGVQLDTIGDLVGEQREGRLDSPYREAILTRIAINRSDGTAPVILEILELLTGSEAPEIFEHFPASFHAYVNRNGSHSVAKTLEDISVAGVEARLIVDDGEPSFSGAASIPSEALFLPDEEFIFEVEPNVYFSIEDEQYISYQGRSQLGHSLLEGSGNKFSQTIASTPYRVNRELFDTGDGYIFQLEDGSLFENIQVEAE